MGNTVKGKDGKGKKTELSTKIIEAFKTKNKDIRKNQFIKQKKARDALKREERFQRKREEGRNPELREQRLATNVPHTLDGKRTWDQIDQDEADGAAGTSLLGRAVDLTRLDQMVRKKVVAAPEPEEVDDNEFEVDSMLATSDEEEDDDEASGSDEDEDGADEDGADEAAKADEEHLDAGNEEEKLGDDDDENGDDDEMDDTASIAPSSTSVFSKPSASSLSTRMDLVPDNLVAKFPTLFEFIDEPKILVTTSINSTLHDEARSIAELFPNSKYVRRSAHRFGHKYSICEISKFAVNRQYSTVVVVNEDMKRPSGLTVVHLPEGPTFHFSISNWVERKRIRGHGNPDDFYPELLLNNFRTPLGLLTAHLFRTMFPKDPEIEGRQVVTLHNQRDYIFVRHHRYIFRNKRETEKPIVDGAGQVMKGVEDIRTGLQELGPRFTLKLRRIDKGIQKASGQEWKWKAESEKVRTRFQL